MTYKSAIMIFCIVQCRVYNANNGASYIVDCVRYLNRYVYSFGLFKSYKKFKSKIEYIMNCKYFALQNTYFKVEKKCLRTITEMHALVCESFFSFIRDS